MPAALLTQQAVSDTAAALATEGIKPTIRIVQERLGGGSYTTVKRYLNIWEAEQTNAPPPVAVPDTIAARGKEFVQYLWSLATALAEEHTRQLREEATAHVSQAQDALAEAEATIARLESEGEAQGQELVNGSRTIERLQNELAQAQAMQHAAEARSQEVERRAEELRSELEQARNAERQLARLEGMAEALRRQVSEQQVMIERLSTGHNGNSQ